MLIDFRNIRFTFRENLLSRQYFTLRIARLYGSADSEVGGIVDLVDWCFVDLVGLKSPERLARHRAASDCNASQLPLFPVYFLHVS